MKQATRALKARTIIAAMAALSLAVSLAAAPLAQAAVKTYKQKGNALADYSVAGYKTVKNKKMIATYKGGYVYDTSGVLKTKKGKKVTFRSFITLDPSENLQSFVIIPSGKYAYALITKTHANSNSQKGWVRKYNFKAIKKNHAQEIAAGESFALTDADAKYIKDGPTFKTGHGQALAYNAKKKQLVNVQANKVVKSNVQLISTKTLKPTKQIKFKLSSTVKMGNNLTFDKKGNAYFYTRSTGGWSPKDSIKLYKGKIDFKKGKVKFKLVMQGIRYPMGKIGQSLGYNPKNNRLYLVDNGQITSVPCSKLGKLKPSNVKQSLFKGKREFEGVTFTKDGTAYLSICNPREIMIAPAGF